MGPVKRDKTIIHSLMYLPKLSERNGLMRHRIFTKKNEQNIKIIKGK